MTTWLRLCVAAIAAHVIDDSFVQPEPGTSAGDHLAGGLVPLAVLAAAAWACGVNPRRIGGLGLSVGGELMIQTAAETRALAAVVSEGASGRSVGEDLDTPGARLLSPQSAISAAMTAGVAVFSGQAPPPNLAELVPRITPRPLFLIHAGIATERLNELYHRIAGEPKALWEIPEGGHTGGLEARPEEYERRVVGFFDAALLR